ncbi:DUF72 domain-containing protein [Candidatus Methanomassiliicoccus intestinalis]|uniref:DUF72 domain-containing protein n=1 Tax=Candidatus Methanomassiliicoccus intestinalis TaxID=1406512 RepID=UPI0037DC7ECE
MAVLIGCSGWAYGDWAGNFYPLDVARKKEEWLRYYASFFETVEINTTFDREPNEYLINGWISRGKSLKNFDYSITLPSRIFRDADRALEFEEWCLHSLEEGGVLGCAVIQTPPDYTNNLSNRENLRSILDLLDTKKYDYLVEFRNQSWFDQDGLLESSRNLLNEYGLSCVVSDEFSPLQECCEEQTYLRLRGTGRSESPGDNTHQYSDADLMWFKNILSRAAASGKKMRVYFENSAAARSVQDALRLMDILEIPHRVKEMKDAGASRIIAK